MALSVSLSLLTLLRVQDLGANRDLIWILKHPHQYSFLSITKSPRISSLRVGNEEHTVSEWSKITGIPRPVIYDRLKRGYSSEAAVSNDASVFRNGKVMSVNGIVKPIEVWAEETGISVLVLRGRIKHGYSPEEAVTIPAKRYSIRSMITHEGQTMSLEK